VTDVVEEKYIVGFYPRNLNNGDNLGYRCNITMDRKGVRWEVVGWISLAQVRDKRRSLANTEIKLQIHKMRGMFNLAEEM